MKYNELPICEIYDVMTELCEEYGSFIDESCCEEVIDKFFDYYPNVTLQGMTERQSMLFIQILDLMFQEIMIDQLSHVEPLFGNH